MAIAENMEWRDCVREIEFRDKTVTKRVGVWRYNIHELF